MKKLPENIYIHKNANIEYATRIQVEPFKNCVEYVRSEKAIRCSNCGCELKPVDDFNYCEKCNGFLLNNKIMKTISEAAKDYILGNRQGYPSKSEDEDTDIFTAGVKFAQQWITVEGSVKWKDENVLLKGEDGRVWTISEYCDKRPINITHWRPIELK